MYSKAQLIISSLGFQLPTTTDYETFRYPTSQQWNFVYSIAQFNRLSPEVVIRRCLVYSVGSILEDVVEIEVETE